MTDLKRSVLTLKGVGPARSQGLERLGVRTVEDLLFFFPRRYEDRRTITAFRDLLPCPAASSIGRVVSVENRRAAKKNMLLTEAVMSDGTALASVLWFNRRNLKKILFPGTLLALHGPVSRKGSLPQFVSPDTEILCSDRKPRTVGSIVPVYPLTSGIPSYFIGSLVDRLLEDELPGLPDPMPVSVKEKLSLPGLSEAILEMHRPKSRETWREARRRLAFDEFLLLQLGLAIRRRASLSGCGAPALPMDGPLRRSLERALPFTLTDGQSSVLREIGRDMASTVPMNRLLQGDVGSGKTAVAMLSMMQALDGGCQSAMMVPTSLLAQQHYLRLSGLLEPLGVRTGLLTGSMAPGERDAMLSEIEAGRVDLVIGTHALIGDRVAFKNLGLVIVDEQHRFGVLQRGRLGKKGSSPHVLVMTATPIPRTLALSVYGDLALSVIRSMPEGRLPVKTEILGYHRLQDLYGFIDRETDLGRRVYWVCPVIEESGTMDAEPLERRYGELSSRFGEKAAMVHGRMSLAERREIMESFGSGRCPILASTTVIEVGLDVPEATVMVIEGAERFGLSQLHQLRGRVGRGKDRSWCFLLTKTASGTGAKRLQALASSSDGFAVAEADMAIRGPGQICGVRQHGITDFRVADLVKDGALLDLARETAFGLVEQDRSLSGLPEIKAAVYERYGEKLNLAGTA